MMNGSIDSQQPQNMAAGLLRHVKLDNAGPIRKAYETAPGRARPNLEQVEPAAGLRLPAPRREATQKERRDDDDPSPR